MAFLLILISPRGTSIRLEAMAYAQRSDLLKIQELQAKSEQSYEQHMTRLENFMEPVARILSNPCERVGESPPDARNESDMDTSIVASSATMCQCCCHCRSLTRSARVVDRIFGTLFAIYSGVPSLAPRCNVSGCAQSCTGPDLALSLTYLFPPWLLCWGISLKFTQATRGFNHHFRLIQYVEYSSPIFRCAYEGNVSRMKALLQARLGSPFDMTCEPQRSLLRVRFSHYLNGRLPLILLR